MAKRKKAAAVTIRQIIDAEIAKTTSPEVHQVLLRIRSKLPVAKLTERPIFGPIRMRVFRSARSGQLIKRYPGPKAKAKKKGGTSSTGPRITRTHK